MINQDNSEVIAALKKAEKMRIDFVANVSHELQKSILIFFRSFLKTPIDYSL